MNATNATVTDLSTAETVSNQSSGEASTAVSAAAQELVVECTVRAPQPEFHTVNMSSLAGSRSTSRRGRKPDLRRIRQSLGINQSELAKTLNVTQAMVSMIESGKAKPGRDLWDKIYTLSRSAPKIKKLRQINYNC